MNPLELNLVIKVYHLQCKIDKLKIYTHNDVYIVFLFKVFGFKFCSVLLEIYTNRTGEIILFASPRR